MSQESPVGQPPLQGPPPRGWRWRAVQLGSLAWLVLVWVALWGDVSFGNVLAGALVGLAVLLVFPLPRIQVGLRLRPLLLVRLVLRFLADVVVASVNVVRVILAPGDLRNAVIRVDLRSGSDLVTTIVAQMTSLVPGSVVVEVHRSSQTLFLHVLDTPRREVADRMRTTTLHLEQRVVHALGIDVANQDREVAGGGLT